MKKRVKLLWGKEIVTITMLICITALILTGHDSLLQNLFVGIIAAYTGLDRIVQTKRSGNARTDSTKNS